jgi:hypothetical protein
MTIIETSANRFYAVTEYDDAALSHVWSGIAVKKVRGSWQAKANARVEMVRKAGCRVVDSIGAGEG